MPARLLRRVLPTRVCVGTRANLGQGMFLMNNNNVDALIVLSSRRGQRLDPIETNFEQLAGIVTRTDIIKTVFESTRSLKLTKIGRVMTPAYEVHTVSTEENVFATFARMLEKQIHHLLVVRNDKDIIGLVNFKDVTRACMGDSEETQKRCLSALAQILDTGLEEDQIEEAPAVYAITKDIIHILFSDDSAPLKDIQRKSGAWIQVLRRESKGHRFIILEGTNEQRVRAKLMIEQLTARGMKLVSLPLC